MASFLFNTIQQGGSKRKSKYKTGGSVIHDALCKQNNYPFYLQRGIQILT